MSDTKSSSKLILKILVVDDEPGMRQMLQWSLGRMGATVDTAEDGKEALQKAEKTHYDIILTDLTMPTMDGLELLARMRVADPKTAVIIVTGFGALETAVYAMQHGASDFILKPFSVDKLIRRLEGVMEYRGKCRHCGKP